MSLNIKTLRDMLKSMPLQIVSKKMGYQKFKSLDKEHLILLTTYEPCAMCKGTIQEYGIKKVVFSFAKRKGDKISNIKNDLKYYYYLKQTKNKRLQYNLFKMHPDFDTIESLFHKL